MHMSDCVAITEGCAIVNERVGRFKEHRAGGQKSTEACVCICI